MTISLTLITDRPLKNKTCNVIYDISNGRSFRKKIITGIKILPRDWDRKNFRVKKSNNEYQILNQRLNELNVRVRTAIAKFDAKQFSEREVISFLEGKTAFGSLDEYIESEIKNTRTSATYTDYRNAIKSLKLHTGLTKKKLMFEDVNYSLLDKFKRNSLNKGLSGSSVNSYFNKIRAIMNDAYDKGLIYEKFELNKKLRVAVRRKPIQSCTAEDFETAIGKIKTIYDWQALGFYLLMFCTRGMYPADIVNFKFTNLQNSDIKIKYLDLLKNEYVEDDISIGKVSLDGFDYLVHRRSKTSDRGNEDMLIRIDKYPTLELISRLKYSVVYTHYNKRPNIVPSLEDSLSIFKYDVDKDYTLHSNIWDIYKKRITKLLGYSFKTARKTFNTYALELEVSDTIRRILLGHSDPSMLHHYDNLNTEAIRDQVEDAHTSVLKRFKASELTSLLIDKLKDINAPELLYSDSIWGGNVRELSNRLNG